MKSLYSSAKGRHVLRCSTLLALIASGIALLAVGLKADAKSPPAIDPESPYSFSAAKDYFPVYIPSEGLAQSQSIAIIDENTWLVGFTGALAESEGDQTVYVTRTEDAGAKFSTPIALETNFDKTHPAGWVELAYVPNTGLTFAFYFWNETGSPLRDGTGIYFRYSDDKGVTWSERQRIETPASLTILEGQTDVHGWFMDQPQLTADGSMLVGLTLIQPTTLADGADNWHTEIFFLRIPDVADIRDPTPNHVNFIVPGKHFGLDVSHPSNGRSFAQEPSLLQTEDRIITVFRTRRSAVYYSESFDDGLSWSAPEPLRYYANGPELLNPAGPSPIRSLGDGRYAILFGNNPGGAWFVEGAWKEYWVPRSPVYLSIGVSSGEKRNAGLRFHPPGQIVTHQGALDSNAVIEASYPDLQMVGSKYLLFYSLTKRGVVFKSVPSHVIDQLSPQPYYREK